MYASRQRNLKHYPITKELQESIEAFRAIDAEIELQPMLYYLASIGLRDAITKEPQESIEAFRAIDAEIELQPMLHYLASIGLREAIRKTASSG